MIPSYSKDDGRRWYALRVFRRRILAVKQEAEEAGCCTYMAMHYVDRLDGRIVHDEVEMVPGLLFIRSTPEWIEAFKRAHFDGLMVYRDAKTGLAAPVDERQMEAFILLTSARGAQKVMLLENGAEQYAKGTRVRVIDGLLKGAEGVIRRIKKDRMFLVSIDGVAVVACTPMPPEFVEKIES